MVGGVVTSIGALVLTSYVFGWTWFQSWVPAHASMKLSSSLCFIVLGLFLVGSAWSGITERFGRVAGSIVVFAGLLNCYHIFANPGEHPLHRMSLGAAISFVALGLAILTVRGDRWIWVSQLLAMGGMLVGLLAVTGYLYDAPGLYSSRLLGTTAVHTALLHLLSGFGILVQRPDKAFVGLFTSSSVAGSSLRSMIPYVAILPLAVGLLAVQGVKLGIYERGAGIGISVLATMVLFGVLEWKNAIAIEGWEARALRANDDLKLVATMLESARSAVIRVDPQGNIRSWNLGATELYGFTAEEVIGQPIEILSDPESPDPHGPPVRPRGEVVEQFRRAKDGSLVEVSLSRFQLHDSLDNVCGYCDVSRNISDLRRLERYSHTLFEHSPVAKVVLNERGIIRSANPAAVKLFGYLPDELVGLKLDDLISEHKESEPIGHSDVLGQRKDGSEFLAQTAFSSFLVGKEHLSVGLIQDVTKERQMEKDVIRAQRLQGIAMFAGTLTHEFNNYLTTILGNAALAMDELEPGSELYDYCCRIDSVAQKAASLARRVLQFSRLEAPETQIGSLRLIALETLAIARTTMLSGWDTGVVSNSGLWAASFDQAQVEQALMNLIKNSSEQPGPGQVIIELANEGVDDSHWASALGSGLFVRLTVRDDRGGLDPEHVERIFEPFFTKKSSGRGTGLGLSVVEGIVKNHGGFATIDNSPGVGLAVHMFFPAAMQEDGPMQDSALKDCQLELAIDEIVV